MTETGDIPECFRLAVLKCRETCTPIAVVARPETALLIDSTARNEGIEVYASRSCPGQGRFFLYNLEGLLQISETDGGLLKAMRDDSGAIWQFAPLAFQWPPENVTRA